MHEQHCTRTFQLIYILLYGITLAHWKEMFSTFYCLFRKPVLPSTVLRPGWVILQVGLDCAYKSSPLGSGLGFSTIILKDMDGQPESILSKCLTFAGGHSDTGLLETLMSDTWVESIRGITQPHYRLSKLKYIKQLEAKTSPSQKQQIKNIIWYTNSPSCRSQNQKSK
jgi:hypothetical protein